MSEEKNTEKTEKKTKAKDTKKGVSFEALSSLDAPVSFWKGIPFGLQHVMAMFVANLAPIFLVATAAKMDAAQSAAIIQAGLLVAGLGTCLQLYGVWLIGSRLPMVTGISFTYVAAAMSIAQHQGYGAVAGAVVLGGLLEVVLGLTAKYWRRFVPPIVDMEVTYTEPGIKGDTASTNSLKPATVNTGATIKVPLFINTGDKIRVDTRTREYYERIK